MRKKINLVGGRELIVLSNSKLNIIENNIDKKLALKIEAVFILTLLFLMFCYLIFFA